MNTGWMLVRTGMNCFKQLGPQGWFLCFVIVMVGGALCMRGYGSRSNY